MQAEPGLELACRARNYRFEHQGQLRQRGVISYYAVQALTQATTMAEWLQEINRLVQGDVDQGRLPKFYQPALQILGTATSSPPGYPRPREAESRP